MTTPRACASSQPSTSANAEYLNAEYLHVGDPDGVGQAMLIGDSEKLRAVAEVVSAPILKNYAWASYYRSIFKIKLSDKYAKRCFKRALEDSRAKVAGVIRCGELLAGNYAISGQTAEWAKTMQTMHDKAYPIAAASLHNTNVVFPGFGSIADRINMHDFYDFPNEEANAGNWDMLIERVLATGKLPPRNAFKTRLCEFGIRCFGAPYYIKAIINGTDVIAIVDTGSTTSLISPSEAAALHLHTNPSPYYWIQSTKSKHVSSHLGYAKDVIIETKAGHDIALMNMKFQIDDELPSKIKVVLGLNVMSRLGSLIFKKRGILVHPRSFRTSCDKPMHIMSTLYGSYIIFFRYPLNGTLQNIVFDSGENQYIFGTSEAKAKRISTQTMITHSERGTGSLNAKYYPAHVEFGDVGGKGFTIPVFPDYKQDYPYVIGSDIFQDYDIALDFAQGRACIIPKS